MQEISCIKLSHSSLSKPPLFDIIGLRGEIETTIKDGEKPEG